MMRDSVCDEGTNIELCLFDGGDCCLEGKDTTLCQNCSCILSVDESQLEQDFDQLNIQPLVDPMKFFDVIGNWSVKVEDVVTGPVCSVLCLEPKKKDQINAWHYDKRERFCSCGWVESTRCPEDLVIMAEEKDLDMSALSMTRQFDAFLQLGKTVPCGMFA